MKIRKNYVYRYKEHGDTPLCIYLCDTQVKNRILIVPLSEAQEENHLKLSVTNQYADMNNYKEILTDNIVSALYLKSNPVKIPENDIIAIQHYIFDDLFKKISYDAHSNNKSLYLFESIYQFLQWKWQKLLFNTLPYQRKTSVYENSLYWAAMGINVGSELNKNRPVLIWKKRCSGGSESNYSYIVIPITSKQKNQKYYMNVPIDINGRSCYLRIEDMRRINIKRISRPILNNDNKFIFIDSDKRQEIMEAIKNFYIFENKYTKS